MYSQTNHYQCIDFNLKQVSNLTSSIIAGITEYGANPHISDKSVKFYVPGNLCSSLQMTEAIYSINITLFYEQMSNAHLKHSFFLFITELVTMKII